MSCISASVLRIGGISADTSRIGGINADVTRRNGINVSVSLLCEVGVSRFLKVLPKETQWISVTVPINYNVISNVEWRVL